MNAPRRSLPDIVVQTGLFLDHWKFTYSATKQMLIRLIAVFLLASSQIIKTNHVHSSKKDKEHVEQLCNRLSGRKSRKRVKLSPTPMAV